ncbi:GTP-binding protein [Geosporobacter ferrireducens]|uniref:sulfate adenylyltransferase n=1 Tax=Geosporobacter ferrireducens TaxID=1424294 RepID=A0A1D8GE37_9FIRM|nr:GTP-binding protein [Geosporobacter ferrireducens]AOT69169.1 adenylyl-sulfate kinase [Geosporobacter ferrireducens]MTI56846.1 GTP-binding protein [Geosporobacter ferrireducens]
MHNNQNRSESAKIINENMNIVIVGHVDHGKSTIIGRLLADTNSLPEGKLEQVKETCRRNAKPFEYAFLLDALKDEQAQGITIDTARVFFKTKKRKYIIIDAPGHIEFLKNMVTGAARAEAALLVIDAQEGIMENSKRHGYLLSMLGIKQVVVLVNKMDLIDYNQRRYEQIVEEYRAFLSQIGVEADLFIPISGFMGDNVASISNKMPWYNGNTVLEKLDLLNNQKGVKDQVFRMPVQSIYKFTAGGDDRRIIAGTIDTGKIRVGNEVIFYPSGKKSKVKSIERFNASRINEDIAGSATGFTLEEQIYVTRGELACIIDERKPEVSTRIKTKLFWLGKENLSSNRGYYIKVGTQRVRADLEEVITVLDASTLSTTTRQYVQRHEVAEVIFKLEKEIAFDRAENLTETSRFVLVDNYEISGGGIVVDSLEDGKDWLREKVDRRNIKWIESAVTKEERGIRYAQKPIMILISGKKELGKKDIARYIERGLFIEGRNVYYLGIGNVLYGIDADIKEENSMEDREAHFRRFAEISNIMLDAGDILIATADDIQESDMNIINTVIDSSDVKLLWVGAVNDHNLPIALHVEENEIKEEIYLKVKKMLLDAKVLFDPLNY